jgi:hypothetical protein
MKKYIIPIVLLFSISSCKTVELTDGTYITKRREKKIFEEAFNSSFGKMTEEEQELLFKDVNFQVDTFKVHTTLDTSFVNRDQDREIKVFTDTSYTIYQDLKIYKELVPSPGDTSITYENDLIIVNGVKYIELQDNIWPDFRIIEIYE